MGLVANALRALAPSSPIPFAMPFTSTGAQPANYQGFARQGYMGNEIVGSAIELRATSAAEPHVIAKRRVSGKAKKALRQALIANGASVLQAEYYSNQLVETVTDHPAIQLLDRPNPFMDRFSFWATVIMHRDLAGNAFGLLLRDAAGKPAEIWLLRPDFVKVIPDPVTFISHYEWRPGGSGAPIRFEVDDVIHWKSRHPLDQYYGMPILMTVLGRLDIDNYMRDFVGAFFRNGANPGAVLAVKQKLNQDAKDELRSRHRSQYGGPGGWFELMILDQAEATYTPTTASLGARGLVVPELNAISEARLAMPFGIPLSILGGLTGQESSSYANKRQDWQVYWDLTLRVLYVELAGPLNLKLLPQYPDLSEFEFDLSKVQALQEDVDKKHDRLRKDLSESGCTLEEFRSETGREPVAPDGHYLIPNHKVVVPAQQLDSSETLVAPAPPLPAPGAPAEPAPPPDPQQLAGPTILAEARHTCGRVCGKNVNVGAGLHCMRCKVNFEVAA